MTKLIVSMVALIAMGSSVAMAGSIDEGAEDVVVIPQYSENSGFNLEGFYAGGGYSRVDSNADFNAVLANGIADNADASTNAMMVNAGYKFNEYIAAEVRYWYGVGDVTFDHNFFTSVEGSTDMDAWGIYAKPILPINEQFDIYGMIGYASSTMENKIFTDNGISGDLDGLSWGIGASYDINENVSVFADYVAFTEDTITNNAVTGAVLGSGSYDQKYDTINFGANYKF